MQSLIDQITYRPAVESDAIRLSVLFKQVYIQTYATEGVTNEFANFITRQFAVERMSDLIAKHPVCLIVAVYKNNLVGAVEIEYDKPCHIGEFTAPELNKLYILECFCGMGVGKGLMRYAEEYLHSLGYGRLWLWVYVLNKRAIAFYEKQGYECIGNAFFQMEQNSYENKVLVKNI